MPTPVPNDPSQAALRSLIWRVVGFFLAGLAVIAAFVIAWRVGAFSPSRPGLRDAPDSLPAEGRVRSSP